MKVVRVAAIYARKSTSQDWVTDENKSVNRQIEKAKAFAARKGWSVMREHIFLDDGISGAEFDRRQGLQQMLAAARGRAFEVLVVSEQKSLGRETVETNSLIKQLAKNGVEVMEYVHGNSLIPKNWLDKAMMSVRSWADEAHREQTRERVHETHEMKFMKRYVVGGRLYGYKNVTIYNGLDNHGRPKRSHVVREIVPEQARVIRRIFGLYDSGNGYKRIASLLNDEGIEPPEPYRRQVKNEAGNPVWEIPPARWDHNKIRSILRQSHYRGHILWNRSRKRDNWGEINPQPRPESEWKRRVDDSLRIVSEELWNRVAARSAEVAKRTVRFSSGRISGRPPKHAVKNLLAGIATCGECGGGLVVETSARKGRRVAEYVCNRRRRNGGCSNSLRMPVDVMNEAVLSALENHALTPEAIDAVIQFSERPEVLDRAEDLKKQRKQVARKIQRFMDAIENGAGDIDPIVEKVRKLEGRQKEIDRELKMTKPLPRPDPGAVEDALKQWRQMLRSSTTQARSILQRVIRGRIVFFPIYDWYDFVAHTKFDRLLSGDAGPGSGADGRLELPPDFFDSGPQDEALLESLGIKKEDLLSPEETYARKVKLIENARKRATTYGKGVVAPTGIEPVSSP